MKGNKKAVTAVTSRDFLRDLAALRARVDELAESYCLSVKGRIDEIGHLLAADSLPRRSLPGPGCLEKMDQKMRKITLKQQKGRAKDLKRLQDLVDALNDALLGEG